MARACVTVAAIGLVLTASCYFVARDVESRLNHQRVERPADAALLGVQQLSAAVDQVLSTAGGVVAATGGDPQRFVAVLGPDVDSSPTLAGIALVARTRGVDRVVTSVGDTTLLTGRSSAALAADGSATLIARRHARDLRSRSCGECCRWSCGVSASRGAVDVEPRSIVRADGGRRHARWPTSCSATPTPAWG